GSTYFCTKTHSHRQKSSHTYIYSCQCINRWQNSHTNIDTHYDTRTVIHFYTDVLRMCVCAPVQLCVCVCVCVGVCIRGLRGDVGLTLTTYTTGKSPRSSAQ